MMNRILLLLIALGALFAPPAMAQEPVERSITELRDGIHRFQAGHYYSILVVGEDGVLVADPIDAETATWLRAEIDSRFGELPVRYLVYSHNHPDHISGGEALAGPETVVIAHELAADDIARHQTSTAPPTVTFSDRLTINFEGRPVRLAYHGPNNGRGSISLHMPDDSFLFVVDWIVLKRLPWREMYYYDLDGMIASIHEVLTLDFDLIAPGHSVTGDKDDVREFLSYLEDLRDAVLDGMNAGLSVEQMQGEIALPAYAHFASYDEWLALNVKGAYDQLERSSARYGQER